MSDAGTGYQAFWMRVARHLSLSQTAKEIGARASGLTAFEKGEEHPLTEEQVQKLFAYLNSIPVPEPEIPEIVDDEV